MSRLLRSAGLLILILTTGCGLSIGNPFQPTPTATPKPLYTLPGGGACVTLGYKAPPPYQNVRVSNDGAKAHSEPMLVENPNNPLNLVGGTKFFSDPVHYRFQIGSFASFDGGCTWTDGGVLPGFSSSETTSDISFAFGPHNDVYAAVLDTDNKNQSGVSVLASHDGGKSFDLPVHVYNNTDGTIFSDKPWIGVNPRDDSLVVVWSYDHQEAICNDPVAQYSCPQELGYAKSTDGAVTWSPVREVEGSASFCTNPAQGRASSSQQCNAVLGATPAFLPDGTLSVVYAYVDLTAAADGDRGPGDNGNVAISSVAPLAAAAPPVATKMVAIASPDGGTTWNAPIFITSIHDIQSPFPGLRFRNFSLPAYAADPHTGQIYLAWADASSDAADILLATSADDGRTWSAPLRVNDDQRGNGALQFQPQLAVAPDGVVSVMFFDTRTDPSHKLIDVFLAQSIDHAKTFLPNQRVTTQSWNPAIDAPHDFNGQDFIGDYQGLAADNSFAHPFWNDTRTGSQEIFTAAMASAQPSR